ncbi:MAG: hypothetical protein ABJK11_11665 [Balneola sp.]
MKNSLLFLSFLFLTATAFAQNTLIVDNTGSAPTGDHVYTNLQTAIDAAQEGDIIHVMPSPISYGNIDIVDKNNLSMIGVGINPQLLGTVSVEMSFLGQITLNNTSKIKLAGLSAGILRMLGNPSTELIVHNTRITGFSIDALTNSVFQNSFINTSVNSVVGPSSSGIQFVNCIITGVFSSIHNSNFTNNIIYHQNNVFSNNILNSVFRNNIIIGYEQFTTDPANSGNSVYEYNFSELSLPISGTNAGNNNISTLTGELFTDGNIEFGVIWNRIWSPELGDNNLINAGNDGTNIGPTGGAVPYTLDATPLPYIQELIAPLTIKKGTNTEVTIKAKGN